MVQKKEKIGHSDSCVHKNDFKYDECVYGVHGQMMKDKMGCFFEFLFGKNDSSSKDTVKECLLDDVNGKDAFLDIVYGIIKLVLFYSLTFNLFLTAFKIMQYSTTRIWIYRNFVYNEDITIMYSQYECRHVQYSSSQSNVLGDFYDGESTKEWQAACNKIVSSFGFPMIYPIKNNTPSKLIMYFETSVSIWESRLAYDKSSLFAEIGGYTGLLLGFSFFDLSKLFIFFSDKFLKSSKGSIDKVTLARPL